MTERRISIALDRYDRTIAYFNGHIRPQSPFTLAPYEVGMLIPRNDGDRRHGRMLHDREFDVAEVSLASYIIAKSRGATFTAAPVFPRRLFSQSQIFVAENSSLQKAEDLAGKRVIIHAFQVTVSVLAKGDLQREYGVPWASVNWLTLADEEMPIEGVSTTRLPDGIDPFELLRQGDAEAIILPHPPEGALDPEKGIRRLFPDTEKACFTHFRRAGYFPIMHLMAIREEAVEAIPQLPTMVMDWNEKAKCYAMELYHDTGYSMIAMEALTLERQNLQLGRNIWKDGLAANRVNLERFISDLVDQKLVERSIPVEELFHETTHAT